MKTSLRVLIADDHPLFRQGLRQVIETEPSLRIVAEAGDGGTALRSIRELDPDICILDIRMPAMDGMTVARQMHSDRSRSQIIFLTMYKEEDLLNAALDLDAKGYVLKESAVTDILGCIRSIAAGHRYISPELCDLLLVRRSKAEALRAAKPGLERLTASERRILKLIAEDKTSKEIADELGLSPRTVENHRNNICAKLDVHGIHSLFKFAYENKSKL